ncbi:MAG: hypothetical protein ACOC4M_06540 [Promethearchaeia archaeon]
MIFFIKSETVDLKRYTIKDIPGSSGRLDVISRNILAALLDKEKFSDNVQIWVFLVRYGTYIFNTSKLNYDTFPKTELSFTDSFVKLIREYQNGEREPKRPGPLSGVTRSSQEILAALQDLKDQGYKIYILKETGEELSEIIKNRQIQEKSVFLVGNQQGEFIESSKLAEYNFKELSLGEKSYLGSHTIRLIKILVFKTKKTYFS